jgi:methylthioribose-1-phosphate isomerase
MKTRRTHYAMEIINKTLGTHGIEYIPRGHNARSPAITYCNTGDSYGTTVLLVRGSYRIGAWADIVERGHYD